MIVLPKQGEKFVFEGFILEAQESGMTCAGCYLYNEERPCTFNRRAGNLPRCADPDNNEDIIYKYVRDATDEEIRMGVADV